MKLWLAIIVILKLFAIIYAEQSLNPSELIHQADFSWDLYKKLFTGFKQNLVVSPYSLRRIFFCLRQLTSEEKTSTLNQQLAKVLRLGKDIQQNSYAEQQLRYGQEKFLNRLTIAAAIGRLNPSKSFRKLNSTCSIRARTLQPGSPRRMGQKVNEIMRTISKGAVKQFSNLSDIDRDWDLFVVDSWRFNGLWKYMFEEDSSRVCNFYTSEQEKDLMKFMYLEETLKYGYFKQWNVKAVELPFHDKSPFSCVLMMPIATNIENLIKSLNTKRFQQIYLKMTASKTEVQLPELKFGSKLPAKRLLQWMDLKAPFSEKVYKVFDQDQGVPLGDIIQKITITMDSKGQIKPKLHIDRRMGNQFVAHRPFIYVIFDKNGLIPVIIGHMLKAVKPKSNLTESDNRICANPPREFY